MDAIQILRHALLHTKRQFMINQQQQQVIEAVQHRRRCPRRIVNEGVEYVHGVQLLLQRARRLCHLPTGYTFALRHRISRHELQHTGLSANIATYGHRNHTEPQHTIKPVSRELRDKQLLFWQIAKNCVHRLFPQGEPHQPPGHPFGARLNDIALRQNSCERIIVNRYEFMADTDRVADRQHIFSAMLVDHT